MSALSTLAQMQVEEREVTGMNRCSVSLPSSFFRIVAREVGRVACYPTGGAVPVGCFNYGGVTYYDACDGT